MTKEQFEIAKPLIDKIEALEITIGKIERGLIGFTCEDRNIPLALTEEKMRDAAKEIIKSSLMNVLLDTRKRLSEI